MAKEITFDVSQEEKDSVLAAIDTLNSIEHLKYMSQAMLAKEANVKPTKMRIILMALLADGLITQYMVSTSKVKRYYYTVKSHQ